MNSRFSYGFTIIELTLAMTFVSVLLLSVAMLSIQLTNIYTRGLTMKGVTQAGTEITNDIKRTMGQSQLQAGGVQVKDFSVARVLCTGSYSYIASKPDRLEAGDGARIKSSPTASAKIVRFAKVRDLNGTLCSDQSAFLTTNEFQTSDAVELLAGDTQVLVVRALGVSPTPAEIAQTTHPYYKEFQQGRGIYKVNITIAAGLTSEVDLSDNTCKPPKNNQSNFENCAINDFEFTARVGSSNRQ